MSCPCIRTSRASQVSEDHRYRVIGILTVLQVLVDVVVVSDVVVGDVVVVVVLSLHPHHPGVLHVSVRVIEVDEEAVVVVVCFFVPFSNFQR